jgi:calcium-dependent protein kinase
LTFEELKVGLKGKENGDTLLELMKSADTDGSGEINYTEFLAATMSANIVMREDYLRTAFQMFDTDKSGKIDKDEIVSLLSGEDLANVVSKDAIGKAMKEID